MIPDWIKKFKRKGTEIKKIGDRYYLYEAKSVWDPELKRAKKVTGKYLGVLTEKGLIKPKHERDNCEGVRGIILSSLPLF